MTTGSRFAQLRHRQLRLMDDEAASLRIARAIVGGKLSNQRALLRRQEGQEANDAVAFLEQATAQARKAENIDSLRGIEGSAGARYFGILKALIPPGWGFTQRVYHPPTDPTNALLSFGYTLLLKDVPAAIQLLGLDPSLALDVMEEFRPLVDGMVLRLIIPDDRRRSRVCHLLKDYGRRVQYSVFECQLRSKDFKRLRERLRPLLDLAEDDVRFYRLCEVCLPKAKVWGPSPRQGVRASIVV